MMCCQACPFNPTSAHDDRGTPLGAPLNDGHGCGRPRCPTPGQTCHRDCQPSIRFRCYQDEYVLRGLPTLDPLAVLLSPFSLDTACEGRDRRLLVELFHRASDGLRGRLWRRLGEHRERALWLINPLFEAAGLPRTDESDLLGAMPEPPRETALYSSHPVPAVKTCGQAAAMFGWKPSFPIRYPIAPAATHSVCEAGGEGSGHETRTGPVTPWRPEGCAGSRSLANTGAVNDSTPLDASVVQDSSAPATPRPLADFLPPSVTGVLESSQAPTTSGTLADGVQRATERAYQRLRRAVIARDADALCDLFLDVPAMLRSALWRYLLLFHVGDLDLLNPLFERHELPPLEPGDVPAELGDYRQALWNVG